MLLSFLDDIPTIIYFRFFFWSQIYLFLSTILLYTFSNWIWDNLFINGFQTTNKFRLDLWSHHLTFCQIFAFSRQCDSAWFKVSGVVITWSWLTGKNLWLVLPRSRWCYKLFINYILRLHVKSFIPARWSLSFALTGSWFSGTKFSNVITSACISGMRKLINAWVRKNP